MIKSIRRHLRALAGAGALFVVVGAGAAEAPVVSLPPFVYTGRVTDYARTGFEGTTKGAEIRAR